MKIKCVKDYEQAEATSIENIKEVHDFLFGDAGIAAMKRNTRLYRYNKEAFLKLWGRQSFCWVGGSEGRRFHVWVHQLRGGQMVVLTHRQKGTCYEYVANGEPECHGEVVNFISKLSKTMRK